MADRTLVSYTEPDDGGAASPYTIKIDRASDGVPGLFITIINGLEEESTIFVDDGEKLLEPVNDWLKNGPRRG